MYFCFLEFNSHYKKGILEIVYPKIKELLPCLSSIIILTTFKNDGITENMMDIMVIFEGI